MNEVELQRLMVRLMGDSSNYTSMLSKATADTQKFAGSAGAMHSGFKDEVASSFQGAAGSVLKYASIISATVIGLTGTFGTLKKAISLAGENETMEVDYGVMLGGMSKGVELVKQMTKMAADTPMTLSGLQRGAKVLLQFGVAGNDVIPSLKMLGDVTGGNSEKMQRMALAYGQAKSAGHLMGQDLLQMINAGFNPLKEIARTTGMTIDQVTAKMHAGGISTKMLTDAFKSATEAGGQFDGLMEKQSHTLTGLMSTLQDNVEGSLRKIGQTLVDSLNLKGMITDLSVLAGNFTDWFAALDAGTVQAATAFGVATMAVIALTAAGYAMYVAFNFATGGLLTIGALIGVVFGGAVLSMTALITSMGGVGEFFSKLKGWASDVIEWLAPIKIALVSLFSTAWVEVQGRLMDLKDFAVGAWRSIFGSAKVNWQEIQDTARDSLYFIEFAMTNIGLVWEGVTAALPLGWDIGLAYVKLITVEGIAYLVGLFMDLSTVLVPAALKYLNDNWKIVLRSMITAVDDFVRGVIFKIGNAVNVVAKFFKNMLTGATVSPAQILAESQKITKSVPFTDGELKFSRQQSQTESYLQIQIRNLRKDYETAQKAFKDANPMGKVMEGFDEFLAKKLAAGGGVDKIMGAAEDLGKGAGDQFKSGLKGAMHDVDSVLSGSAEALRRYTGYRNQMIDEQRTKAGTLNADGTLKGSGNIINGGKPIVAHLSEKSLKKTEDHLRNMVDILDDIRNDGGLRTANL